MDIRTERRLLQAAIAFAALVPLTMGVLSIVQGPAVLRGISGPAAADLDSHFRYLSGLLFGIGIGFALCIPRIESKATPFRALGLIVFAGGLARLLSLVLTGVPSEGHLFGLAMEVAMVPLLLLWQARVSRRYGSRRPR